MKNFFRIEPKQSCGSVPAISEQSPSRSATKVKLTCNQHELSFDVLLYWSHNCTKNRFSPVEIHLEQYHQNFENQPHYCRPAKQLKQSLKSLYKQQTSSEPGTGGSRNLSRQSISRIKCPTAEGLEGSRQSRPCRAPNTL